MRSLKDAMQHMARMLGNPRYTSRQKSLIKSILEELTELYISHRAY